MKKIILSTVFIFASFALVNAKNEIKSNQNKLDKIEYVDPEICWAGANAVELYSCGNIGCNFNVWADAYSSCMGY